MVKEFLRVKMWIAMMDNGWIIKEMALESKNTIMEINMKDNG